MDTPHRILRNMHMQNVKKASTPLKIPASPFMKNLGYGTCVNVYRLDRPTKSGQVNSPWAVKRVSKIVKADTDVFNARIEEEAKILRKLSHPNIVGFRGLEKTDDGIATLALECCKTSLGDIIEERKSDHLGPLPAKQIVKVAVDVCRALDYLHTEAKLLHGDLKSYNVLVKGEFDICKLCDFGVSLPLDDDGVLDFTKHPELSYVGTNLWCAPEVLDESDVLDCKADMFSFGLIIYETIALVPPHTIDISSCDDESTADADTLATDADISLMEPETSTIDAETSGIDPETSGMDPETSAIDAGTSAIDAPASATGETNFDNDVSMTQDVAMAGLCGTRPPLPSVVELHEDYNRVVEVFYLCTNELAEDRPTAKVVWQSLENELPTEKPAEKKTTETMTTN